MTEEERLITAKCPLFVCQICHTKTGHAHQRWCTLPEDEEAVCKNCAYMNKKRIECTHPYRRKGGEAK